MSTQICGECQKTFTYPNNEYNRRIKKGITKFFCSRSCASKYRNKNRPVEVQEKINKSLRGNKNGCKNSKGKFTYYLNKARNRRWDFDIDEEHLESIWTGKCSYTNIPIILAQSSSQFKTQSLYNASLDRIDSSKGYIKGNVQWVCLGINYAKNGFSHEEMIKFIRKIAQPL